MLIAHISDFHVFSRAPETSLVRLDAEAAARKVMADLAAFVPSVDAVCFTGDLTDGGSTQDYALLKDILAPIRVPIYCVPGNHDRRATLRAAFAAQLPFAASTTLHYETAIGDIRILALDTLIEGRVEGALDADQLAWLADRLAIVQQTPTLILMHHPAFPSGMAPLDAMSLVQGREDFAAIVAAYPGPLRILSGHIHRPYQSIWNGAFCAVAGSPAFQHELALDPAAPEPGVVDEPYAYFIHRLGREGQLSVHTRYVAI